MSWLTCATLLVSVTHLGCQTARVVGFNERFSVPPGGGYVQAMREHVLRQAPAEISGRPLRDAILFMESRSKVAALALRHVAQELAPPEEGSLVVFKLLEDELTRGDEALVYFEVAARDGAVWQWYGRVRMNDTNLDVEWKSVSRHGRPGIRSPPGR